MMYRQYLGRILSGSSLATDKKLQGTKTPHIAIPYSL